jgi:hypothetical protein
VRGGAPFKVRFAAPLSREALDGITTAFCVLLEKPKPRLFNRAEKELHVRRTDCVPGTLRPTQPSEQPVADAAAIPT